MSQVSEDKIYIENKNAKAAQHFGGGILGHRLGAPYVPLPEEEIAVALRQQLQALQEKQYEELRRAAALKEADELRAAIKKFGAVPIR